MAISGNEPAKYNGHGHGLASARSAANAGVQIFAERCKKFRAGAGFQSDAPESPL
jgi:hypothetical protein